MRTFWLIWTYVANFSEKPLELPAASPEDAVKQLTNSYGEDFADKATIYVFDREPVHVYRGAKQRR